MIRFITNRKYAFFCIYFKSACHLTIIILINWINMEKFTIINDHGWQLGNCPLLIVHTRITLDETLMMIVFLIKCFCLALFIIISLYCWSVVSTANSLFQDSKILIFFSSPEHEVLKWAFVILQCPASVVRRPSVRACVRPCVNNFFKQHLLWNRLLDFD